MRKSTIITKSDPAGPYEIEKFEAEDAPKSVIVCSHGNGVRRWDGEHFFHNLADHYPDRTVFLVDQNQLYEDGCKLNDLAIMEARVQELIETAANEYPGVPIIAVGHSMGCGVLARLNLSKVAKVIFVAPAAGDQEAKLIGRHGEDIMQGKVVKSSDGLTKFITKEFAQSVRGILWEQEYLRMLEHYSPVYVFESGDEEIVGEERRAHRDMPFTGYQIIPGAKHNFAGEPLQKLFGELDKLV